MTNCVVCQRIPAKTVFRAIHNVTQNKTVGPNYTCVDLTKKEVHALCVEAVEIINYADKKNRIFFCGKPQRTLLAGLIYALSLKHHLQFSMRGIGESLKVGSLTQTGNSPTVSASYQRWIKNFPEKFPNDVFSDPRRRWKKLSVAMKE